MFIYLFLTGYTYFKQQIHHNTFCRRMHDRNPLQQRILSCIGLLQKIATSSSWCHHPLLHTKQILCSQVPWRRSAPREDGKVNKGREDEEGKERGVAPGCGLAGPAAGEVTRQWWGSCGCSLVLPLDFTHDSRSPFFPLHFAVVNITKFALLTSSCGGQRCLQYL